MSLQPGARLGPYEVVELIGAGGMGEVYRARDPRLDRDVAIKVLPREVAADTDRLRRLQDEARAVAALSHPHICQIFDVGPDYLVLEFIDGQPLSCPVPASRALDVALQIASALEAAHGRGIFHRDLEPQNVMLTPSGAAKLLDFGLAKIAVQEGEDDATRTTAGTVLGTTAYMSPELDPSEPAPHWLLGALAAAWDYDWPESERRFNLRSRRRRRRRMCIGDTEALSQGPRPIRRVGGRDRRQVQVDPLNVSWRAVLAAHLNHAERHDEAIEQATTALTINEHHWVPAMVLAQSYGHLGRWDEAVESAERAYRSAQWNGLAAGGAGRGGRTIRPARSRGRGPAADGGTTCARCLAALSITCGAKRSTRRLAGMPGPSPFAIRSALSLPPLRLGARCGASAHWPPLAKAMNLPLL